MSRAKAPDRALASPLPPARPGGTFPPMRNLFAVALGLAVAVCAVMAVEVLGHSVYPPPVGLSLDDPKAISDYIAGAPALALAVVLFAWAAGAFAGGTVAALVATGRRTQRFGLIIGAVVLVMGAMTLWMIPHPTWFILATPLACLIPGWYGGLVGARREAY